LRVIIEEKEEAALKAEMPSQSLEHEEWRVEDREDALEDSQDAVFVVMRSFFFIAFAKRPLGFSASRPNDAIRAKRPRP
jgi:hypothetical protein